MGRARRRPPPGSRLPRTQRRPCSAARSVRREAAASRSGGTTPSTSPQVRRSTASSSRSTARAIASRVAGSRATRSSQSPSVVRERLLPLRREPPQPLAQRQPEEVHHRVVHRPGHLGPHLRLAPATRRTGRTPRARSRPPAARWSGPSRRAGPGSARGAAGRAPMVEGAAERGLDHAPRLGSPSSALSRSSAIGR